ncbi:MAG: DUF4149 domain-containing protein [Bacteroidetes bacterium]|nr:DUF4149 domain-containing protein [Bacteroidota bacterium]
MDNLFVKTLLSVIHNLATVIWIGGMFVNMLVFMPTTKKVLDPSNAGKLMQAIMKRFRIVVYTSIVILGVTGIPLKIVNPNYIYIINFENQWEIISFVKHIFYGLLTVLAIYNFEIVSPKIARLAKEGPSPKLAAIQNQLKFTGMLAMFSALVILVLSSMMRFL